MYKFKKGDKVIVTKTREPFCIGDILEITQNQSRVPFCRAVKCQKLSTGQIYPVIQEDAENILENTKLWKVLK